MHLNRRGFLGAALGGTAFAGQALAQRATTRERAGRVDGAARHLVVVQLLGGNDDLQLVCPFEDGRYHRARPGLRLRPRELQRLDELNGLHPSFRQLARRYAEGQLAIVRGVGYPAASLSHFRSQDVWDLGSTREGGAASGWLGRWAQQQRAPRADGVPTLISTGGPRLPLAFAAAEAQAIYLPVPEPLRLRYAPAGASRGEAHLRERALVALHGLVAETDVFARAHGLARNSAQALARADEVRSRASYPGNPLARALAFGARAFAAGVGPDVLHVVHDGYDTHSSQRKLQDRLLRELDAALAAFLEDLEQLGLEQRVVVVVVSEFGRRLAESGRGDTAGTDHGVAGSVLLAGAPVRGGIFGGQPRLGELDGAGNVPWSIDFRRVYATLIERWLGGDAGSVLGPGFDALEVLA